MLIEEFGEMVNVCIASYQRRMDGVGAAFDTVNFHIGVRFDNLSVVLPWKCSAGGFVSGENEGRNLYR